MKKDKQQLLIAVTLSVVIAGILGFFAGTHYTQYQRKLGRNGQFPTGQFLNQANGLQTRNGINGGKPVLGEVIAKDKKTVTVKTQDGGSRIIVLTEKTVVNKAQEAQMEDIVVGMMVNVFGTENTDKSVTAQNIQLNPQLRMEKGQ